MPKSIGYLQYDVIFGDTHANLNTVRAMVHQNANADLLILPELALTGYDFQDKQELSRYAEPFGDGPASRALTDLAAETDCTLVMGYPETTPDGFYNSAIIALPDGQLFNYRKIHLFSRETTLFLSGNTPPLVVDTPAGRIGIMICFDWIFPETARSLALQGAQIIAHPSNLVLDYCQQAMYCRCVENGVFAITANRIGTERRAGRTLTFTGASQVMDTAGKRLLQAPVDTPHAATILIDPEEADNKYITPENHRFDDRRTDMYLGL